ncbi:MAG TPA: hypothetical protein VK508_17135 [Cyclobacteriaceae bacterium]|nr:hypothetical protein [Cyclobacteriaceae bacterium]
MISLIVVVIVAYAGREFYYLAIRNNKNRFLFGFIGIASYFTGVFIGSVILNIVAPDFSKSAEPGVFTGYTIPAGILAAIAIYFLLKRSWSR